MVCKSIHTKPSNLLAAFLSSSSSSSSSSVLDTFFATDRMVSMDVENPIHGIKLSSVVPAEITGQNKAHELSSMDLVMKLHYLKGLYFFTSNAAQGIRISDLKEPMFKWLELYYMTCGRIRRSESGRPFIKCNDSGVRIIEAKCDKTVEEFLEMKDFNLQNKLAFSQVLGPELAFSPMVYIQFTWFKCGGLSVGLSWAHVLGDVFAASRFINMWGQNLARNLLTKTLKLQQPQIKTVKAETKPPSAEEPLSVRKVEPVGDYWVTANNCKMETFSFQLTAIQLDHLQSKLSSQSQDDITIPTFEAISAVIWRCVAKTSEGNLEPRLVSICRNHFGTKKESENKFLSNNQILSVANADFSIVEAKPVELALLMINQSVDENSLIDETIERDQGLSDYIAYGANLTFVNLEDAGVYGLELKGQKPIFANYTIENVGKEGVVLVLPGPENVLEAGPGGRTVTVILQENQIKQLIEELKKEWSIV